MKRSILTSILTVALFLLISSSAYAAPYGLIANFVSEDEVELNWGSEEGDSSGYDVWYSRNGVVWEKLNSGAVNVNTYIIGSGVILPYVNYYFIVTEAGVVQNNNPLDTSISSQTTDIAIIFSQKDNVHGNYKKNTNACAKCHRTHSANAPALLITNTINDTCITCHDGTQSKYDVLKGEIQTSSSGDYFNSPAGPFGNLGIFNNLPDILKASYDSETKKYTVENKAAPWLDGFKATTPRQYWTRIYVVNSGEPVPDVFTSNDWKYSDFTAWNEALQVDYGEAYFTDDKNLIDGRDVYVQFGPIVGKDQSPITNNISMSIHSMGNGVTLRNALKNPGNPEFAGSEWDKPLGCGSCHSVHAQEYDEMTETFTSLGNNFRMLANKLPANNDIRVLGFSETVNDQVYGFGEKIYYKSGINEFCLGCHADYTETVNETVYVKMINRDRHELNVAPWQYDTNLPLQGEFTQAGEYNQNKIMCLTCHSAHGSNSYRNNLSEPNFLVRADGPDGICAKCHSFD